MYKIMVIDVRNTVIEELEHEDEHEAWDMYQDVIHRLEPKKDKEEMSPAHRAIFFEKRNERIF